MISKESVFMNQKPKEYWNIVDIDIPQCFEVSTLGNVRTLSTKRSVDIYHSTNGFDYCFVQFENRSIPCLKRIDKIVAYTFIPVPEKLLGCPLTVRHKDGNISNNRVDNLEWCEDIENWKYIDYDEIIPNRYMVSSWGRIKLVDGSVTVGIFSNGYYRINLKTIHNEFKLFQVHRLVSHMFLNDPNSVNMVINHIDGEGTNNFIDNLEWVTRAVNNKHACFMGLHQKVVQFYIRKRIEELLLINPSPIVVLREIHNEGYVHVTEDDVSRIKRSMSKTHTFERLNKLPMSDIVFNKIKELLIAFDGDIQTSLKELHGEGYQELSIHDVKTVKRKISKEYNFPNLRMNRKIREVERKELEMILERCDLSPSKAFAECVSLGYKNITIHDIKYIKRCMNKKEA